jgi:RimJ/RimL family protein N-acetyltransferase
MELTLTTDVREFVDRAAAFLATRLESNVMATILEGLLEQPTEARFAYGCEAGGSTMFAAMQTAPFPVLVTAIGERDAEAFVRAWLSVDPDMPGVNAPPRAARAVAGAWECATGGSSHVRLAEVMHVLEAVLDPPRPAGGILRVAAEADRATLIEWTADFLIEANIAPGYAAESMVARRMHYGGLLLWEADGPRSMVGFTRPVSGVVRIGPVYTPPAERGRGYAGTAVAAVSRRALAQGAERCMLLTDITNPTSNKIYAEVGYRPCGAWEEIVFSRA